ncbi:PRC-barrel domain-containing protein [Domibacillus sp. DTU_2020_1001157_1_SI_ALB_TIR_016]|uniref:PRC-barrel domain-containing protein n=1 Tax=Domibacillus sp. DTU_2020_1001157_1_SI_ALB_TIR_016 TaxID=3077789 RepID=UPI0028F122B5|nr:PRC-barrel domain-containing protein [Domibacillus sp. DTU_2020_1001157_1_SI_ALB_TIR_016]WNS81810.1 PRC-barrel domain-containing protein [Domibacillus sp. DTU_2020_1001157_1_SI_ALB_TIR_016]
MKKSSEVQGLPIISIADGVEIGQVKSLIINPEKRSIDFITIGHEEWEQEGKAIPFNKIIGIGDYALTIDHESSVIEMNSIPVANELLNRRTKIEQTPLMSKKGQLIGQAVEYMIDDETGEISQLVVEDKQELFLVSGQYVITYGRDLIVVDEDVVKESIEGESQEPYSLSIDPVEADASAEPITQPDAHAEHTNEEPQPASEKPSSVLEVIEPVEQEVETVQEKAAAEPAFEELEEEPAPKEQEESSVDRWLQLIEEQQSKLLAGKTVTKNIEVNGEILIPAGTVLQEEEIQKARTAGSEILVELSMNSEA